MNKTIYMTYKKEVPEKVFNRWTKLNKDWTIDFSKDDDCINFIRENFSESLADLFEVIPEGMYKADLWRLCKLYINGGVYADVDLVPYFKLDDIDNDITFCSCLSIGRGTVFQALILNNSKPKNPLILSFLITFLLNKAYNTFLGPTIDMGINTKYNIWQNEIKPFTKYEINEVKIPINIGKSPRMQRRKTINLHYFPKDLEYTIKLKTTPYSDTFNFEIKKNYLIVTRLDANDGWEHDHLVFICIKSREVLYFFQEVNDKGDHWSKSYVVDKDGNKILDSRDMEYFNNGRNW